MEGLPKADVLIYPPPRSPHHHTFTLPIVKGRFYRIVLAKCQVRRIDNGGCDASFGTPFRVPRSAIISVVNFLLNICWFMTVKSAFQKPLRLVKTSELKRIYFLKLIEVPKKPITNFTYKRKNIAYFWVKFLET